MYVAPSIKRTNFWVKNELIDQHVTSMEQIKNLSPRQDSNLRPPKHRAGVLSTWAKENS